MSTRRRQHDCPRGERQSRRPTPSCGARPGGAGRTSSPACCSATWCAPARVLQQWTASPAFLPRPSRLVPDVVPCGVKLASKAGKILMNPDDDYVLREGDEVLVIAQDDTYAPAPLPEVHKGFLPNIPTPPKYPEKILFCGWRRDIHDMLMILEAFLAPGSELRMFNEVPEKERERKLTDGGMDICGLTNIKLVHQEGNAIIKRHLESLPLETFDTMSQWRTPLYILIHGL